MKRLAIYFLPFVCLILLSWGSVGHRTVASIAEKHLTLGAKAAVKTLLGNESLAYVSTWADELRKRPGYKFTAPWHFVNVPPGLRYKKFSAEVERQGDNNLYAAIINNRSKLFSGTPAEKVIALKFLVHLIGDAHQPIDVSHEEDKGGNNIQVQFMGRGTNLHSLWHSGLIDYQKSSYGPLATEFDTATPEQIKRWQTDDFMQWLWESYQISSKLYQEVESGNKLDERYYRIISGLFSAALIWLASD